MSVLFGIRLFAAPALIGLASLAGKRWGPNAAGFIGGLPLVGGPVILALWLSQGEEAAGKAASAAPVGVWATMIYLLVVGYASARWRWYFAIPLGWICYLAAQWTLHEAGFAMSQKLGLAVLPGLWLAATRWLPKPAAATGPAHLPNIELGARMCAAVALVFSLTAVSSRIGPDLTGMLSGAPVAATVIPAFTLANAGRDALLIALRGFLTGLAGFAVFFLVMGDGIQSLGVLVLIPAIIMAVVAALILRALIWRSLVARNHVA